MRKRIREKWRRVSHHSLHCFVSYLPNLLPQYTNEFNELGRDISCRKSSRESLLASLFLHCRHARNLITGTRGVIFSPLVIRLPRRGSTLILFSFFSSSTSRSRFTDSQNTVTSKLLYNLQPPSSYSSPTYPQTPVAHCKDATAVSGGWSNVAKLSSRRLLDDTSISFSSFLLSFFSSLVAFDTSSKTLPWLS